MRDTPCTCPARCAEPHVMVETIEDVERIWGADSLMHLAVKLGHASVPIEIRRKYYTGQDLSRGRVR